MGEAALNHHSWLRDSIYRQGVTPTLAADVWALASSCREANLRRRGPGYRSGDDDLASPHPEVRVPSVNLRHVPDVLAPFCHDVCLYRTFMGPADHAAAKRWLGVSMWHLVTALGGWQRVCRLPLGRLSAEGQAARMQMPTFLVPPAHSLSVVDLSGLREILAPWCRKVRSYHRLRPVEMQAMGLTGGAWLWLLDRAQARLVADGGEDGACRKLMASAYKAKTTVGLSD